MRSPGQLLELFKATNALTSLPTSHPHRSARLASPWSTADLERVVWSDIFGTDAPVPVTRAEAMSVPAHSRSRHIVVGALAPAPLVAYRGGERLDPQPAWLYRTDTAQAPQLRVAWTIDDLIHFGWSLWACQRNANGTIADAFHIPYAEWDVDQSGAVTIGGMALDPATYILFEGLHEGVLAFGSDTLRTAKRLERTVANRAANPTPVTELHDTGDEQGNDLDEDEAKALVNDYATGRMDTNGHITYTPQRIELKLHGDAGGDLLINARNAAAVDLARHNGLPASLIDATGPSASLKYETAQGRSLELSDYTLGLYTTPINARLSLDDCTPRGTRIAFDLSDLRASQPAPTGPPLED